jgi:hypothetical protein
VQTKQETNEFVVLNAGAYHAGYNTGFNCAEAVNFATDDWLQIGKDVQRCKCGALKDGVRISMRSFGLSDSSDDSSDEEDEVSWGWARVASVKSVSLVDVHAAGSAQHYSSDMHVGSCTSATALPGAPPGLSWHAHSAWCPAGGG